ncbi:hypothetical protein TNCV_2900491 [Trichonephila clavipes]|nr:hypothetical protein TNCV_2900491 [Trichonephila clavipes]
MPRAHQAGFRRRCLAGVGLSESVRCHGPDEVRCPTGIVVNDVDCGAVELGSNPGEDMDVCKCIQPLRFVGTLNRKGEERGGRPLATRRVSSL